MSQNNRRDWFSPDNPFEWDAETQQQAFEEGNEDFEYILRFPLPADKVVQSVRMVKDRLVVEYRFVFAVPQALDPSEE